MHFGNCKDQILDLLLISIRCKLVNILINNITPLTYWKKGMSVILEKALRKINASKIRVILLLEADFNAINNIIFNRRILSALK